MHYTSILIIINIHGIKDDIVLAFTFMWTGQNQRAGETTNHQQYTSQTPARQTSSSITDSSRERRTKRSENKRSEQQREVTVPVLLLHQDCTHECYSPSSYAIICHDMSSNVIIYRLVDIVTLQALFTIKGGAPPEYQGQPDLGFG